MQVLEEVEGSLEVSQIEYTLGQLRSGLKKHLSANLYFHSNGDKIREYEIIGYNEEGEGICESICNHLVKIWQMI